MKVAKESGSVIVSIQDLHQSFDNEVVLDGVDLDIFDGETMVVLGASGSGKSVMMSLLVGQNLPANVTGIKEGAPTLA